MPTRLTAAQRCHAGRISRSRDDRRLDNPPLTKPTTSRTGASQTVHAVLPAEPAGGGRSGLDRAGLRRWPRRAETRADRRRTSYASITRSNKRSGLPLKGHPRTKAVWGGLAVVFGRADGAAAGIVTTQPAAGGLSRWMRTADGAWAGVVSILSTWPTGGSRR